MSDTILFRVYLLEGVNREEAIENISDIIAELKDVMGVSVVVDGKCIKNVEKVGV